LGERGFAAVPEIEIAIAEGWLAAAHARIATTVRAALAAGAAMFVRGAEVGLAGVVDDAVAVRKARSADALASRTALVTGVAAGIAGHRERHGYGYRTHDDHRILPAPSSEPLRKGARVAFMVYVLTQ
jgi:hypothetical protein